MNKENATKVRDYLKSKGLSKKEITALMANIAVESGYTFDFTKKQEGKRSDPAQGLFQFDPRDKGLLKIYKQYLTDKEKTDSMESQLDFMVDSLKGNYTKGTEHIGYGNVKKYNKLIKTGNAEDITQFFSNRILNPGKPHMDRRLQAAKDLMPMVYEEDKNQQAQVDPEIQERAAQVARTFPQAMQ